MSADTGTFVLTGGMAVALALALASAISWRSARTARDERLRGSIAASRERVDGLRRQLADGQITQEAFDEQESRVAEGLLERTGSVADPGTAVAKARRTRTLAIAALLVAVAAGALYAWLARGGPPSDAGASAGAPATTASAPTASASDVPHPVHALSDDQLQRMIDQTRSRIQKDPKDAAAWAMLAHSYDMMGKFAESSKAYASLVQLVPNDAQVLADYADALAVANGRSLAGEPTTLIRKALAIDGRNVKALTLAGTAAFEREDYAEAVAHWQKARDLSKDPEFIRQIDVSLANAKASAKGLPMPAPASAPVAAATPAHAASAVVAGRLTLADDLQAKAPPDATVFIFATPVGGSRMPVAIMRRHVRDLPLEFSLDDTLSMVPDMRLSKVSTVVIGARISRRGDVAPQPGDMQGSTAPVAVGTRGIRLEISEVLK